MKKRSILTHGVLVFLLLLSMAGISMSEEQPAAEPAAPAVPAAEQAQPAEPAVPSGEFTVPDVVSGEESLSQEIKIAPNRHLRGAELRRSTSHIDVPVSTKRSDQASR